jgi:tRNA/tmRNA/rRNA uracil-C5-methylase (TrmA/RlmC/RlmD family)
MDTVREFAGDFSKKTVLDLYCGSGFFSIALASCSTTNRQRENITLAKIIGVELVPEAIRDARINAELNGTDVEFYEAKMEDFDWSKYKADVVILDPPRSGMHDKMLESVLNVRPETIVYVSCNYKNFARELVRLREFYSVETMRAIDMFPHTPHVELISKLVRTSSTS